MFSTETILFRGWGMGQNAVTYQVLRGIAQMLFLPEQLISEQAPSLLLVFLLKLRNCKLICYN